MAREFVGGASGPRWLWRLLLGCALACALAGGAHAAAARDPALPGIALGDGSFVIGGFATVEADDLEDGVIRATLDANLFLFYELSPRLNFFTALEFGTLVAVQDDGKGLQTDIDPAIERWQFDYTVSNETGVRFGRFFSKYFTCSRNCSM